jgi:hypothetical protein
LSLLTKLFWIVAIGVSLAVTGVVGFMAMERHSQPEEREVRGRIGDVVRIGDLELTVLGTATFTNGRYSFSTANQQVRFRATNLRTARDAVYDLAYTDIKLFDNTGAVRDAVPCVQCPGSTGDDLTVRLAAGRTIDGVFYYKLPPGTEPVWLKYHSFLADKDAKIDLRSVATVGAAPPR